jgi:hypothetical protein
MNIHFYDEKGNIYNNHIDAIKSGQKCLLYYEDAFYDNVTWKIEPSLSLKELYKLRAQEIRDTYEYVILFLSGGVDSRNVFESFYLNKIHIDEIVCVGAFSQDRHRGSKENNNDEIYVNTNPLLDSVFLPNTKITYIDYTKLFTHPYEFELIKKYGDEWAYKLSYFKSFHLFFWYEIQKHLDIDNSKKTCYIMGVSKTTIGIDNKSKFVIFHERDLTDFACCYSMNNLHRENFYFSPTQIGADIVKKQAFIMSNLYDLSENKTEFINNYFNTYNKIIYDLKFPLVMNTRKTNNNFFSHRDTYMQKHTESEIYKIWYAGLQKLSSDIGLNYAPHFSKKYYIT